MYTKTKFSIYCYEVLLAQIWPGYAGRKTWATSHQRGTDTFSCIKFKESEA